ncbi:MAG: PQQ-binding-like beta-propeller repeat protein [Planctomycetota bacterium]
MNCDQVRERLELLVLDGLAPREKAAVRAHLASCPACRAAEGEYRNLVDRIQAEEQPVRPRPGLADTLREAARRETRAARRRTLARRALLTTAATAALLVLSVGLPGLWPADRGGPETSRGMPRQTPDEGRPAERWQYAGARAVPASAADEMLIRGDTMYLLRLAELGSCVAAVDAATGETRWESDTPSLGYLAADGPRVFCLSSLRPQTVDLVALDASSGEPLWRLSRAGVHRRTAARPVPVEPGRVGWVAGGTVHLLEAASGDGVWSRPLEGGGAPFAVAGGPGRLYVFGGGVMTCLEARSGAVAWRKAVPADIEPHGRPTLAVAGSRLFLTSEQGDRLVCVDTSARRVLWQRPVDGGGRHLLAGSEAVYVRGGDRVQAFAVATGDRLWSCRASGCGAMSLVGGRLCFADTTDRGRLVALDRRTGQPAWQIAGIRSCDGFARVGGTGYIKTQDGIVHAIALAGPGTQ